MAMEGLFWSSTSHVADIRSGVVVGQLTSRSAGERSDTPRGLPWGQWGAAIRIPRVPLSCQKRLVRPSN